MAFATAGTLAFLRGRDTRSGALLGLGAFVKLYPGLLADPVRVGAFTSGREGPRSALGRCHRRRVARREPSLRDPRFRRLGLVLPLQLAPSPGLRQPLGGALSRASVSADAGREHRVRGVGGGGYLVVVACSEAAVGRVADLDSLPFPLLVMVLLTGKVWSSQYSLWLLPWFAVTSVPWFLFLEYRLAEVAEYLVRYHYFGTVISGHGISYWVLGAIVLIRAALLLRCLLHWVRYPDPVMASAAVRRDRCGCGFLLSLACPRPRKIRDRYGRRRRTGARGIQRAATDIERSCRHRAQEIRPERGRRVGRIPEPLREGEVRYEDREERERRGEREPRDDRETEDASVGTNHAKRSPRKSSPKSNSGRPMSIRRSTSIASRTIAGAAANTRALTNHVSRTAGQIATALGLEQEERGSHEEEVDVTSHRFECPASRPHADREAGDQEQRRQVLARIVRLLK